MNAFVTLLRGDLRATLRRSWYPALVAAGLVGVAIATVAAAGDSGAARVDTLRSGGASVLLLGGLVLALTLGATAFWGAIQSGHLGVQVAAGAPRAALALARATARLLLLAAAVIVWTIALLVAAATLGHGFDGDLLLHGGAVFETLAFTLLATAAASTVLGPAVAAVLGLMAHITAQATVNLAAAADVGRLGVANRLAHVAYNILPRSVTSPMIAEMQNRGAGGPAAPQFEINELPVPIGGAGLGTVLWTLAWCGIMLWLCFVGLRRRNLS